MSEPTRDPLAAVYWRRRIAAAGGVVVVLLIFGWALGGFFDDEDDEFRQVLSEEQLRPSRPPSTPPPPSVPASRTTTSSAPTTSPGPPTTPPPVQAAPPQGPPGPCPDTVMAVAAEVGAAEYRVGQRPQLRLVVANTGPVPCIRDLNRQFRELVVTTPAGARVWSSQDCYVSQAPELRTFSPGTRKIFPVTWSGRGSAPGCPAGRQPAGAGTYLLTGRFGGFVSAPVPFTLR
jgi:hypothetical protein